MIVKELQKCFGDIYFGGNKNTATYVFFIMENIRIDCHMYAAEFEGLLYTILSEEPFKKQRFHMIEEKDDYTITDYVYQHFGMLIGETMTCTTFHQN